MNDEDLTVLKSRLDELESREAIRELSFEYCHGFDKRDYDRFMAIWWEDCVWDIGPPFGRFEGHQGIHTALTDVLWPVWQESHHLTSNNRINLRGLQGSDRAESVCDVDCVGMLVDDVDCQIVGATYTDQLERRNGIWKILERKVQIHYFNPLPGAVLKPPESD